MGLTLALLGAVALFALAAKGRTYPMPPSYQGVPAAASFEELGSATGETYVVRQWPPNANDVVFVLAYQKRRPDYWLTYWHRREDGERTLREADVPDSQADAEAYGQLMLEDFDVKPSGPSS